MKAVAMATGALALALAGCSEAGDTAAAPAAAVTQSAEGPSKVGAEEDIRHFLLQTYPDSQPLQYALAWSDLDGDGSDEAIVHVVSPMLCGTGGCNTLVLTRAGPMWRTVGEISVSRTPVTVMESASNGWKDITVAISGGGGPSGVALLKFDGEAYPGNPTVPPAEMTETPGKELLPEEPDMTPLPPMEAE